MKKWTFLIGKKEFYEDVESLFDTMREAEEDNTPFLANRFDYDLPDDVEHQVAFLVGLGIAFHEGWSDNHKDYEEPKTTKCLVESELLEAENSLLKPRFLKIEEFTIMAGGQEYLPDTETVIVSS